MRLTDSPTTRPVSTGAATSWWAETISSASSGAVVVLVAAALEHRELVGAHHAALDEGGGVGVGDVVGELPAQRARAELAGAGDHAAGDDPGALGVELVALAEPGDQPALAVGVGERELAEARLGLARLDERAKRAVRRVVRDPFVLEQTDRDRVRARLRAAPRWWRGRPCEGANTRVLCNAQHRDPQRRPHARREARRRPLVPARDEARGDRHRGGARARSGRARPGPARRHGPGAAGGAGADPVAPGPDRGGHPQGGHLGDHQQGVRLRRARGGHPRHRDPRR